MTRSHAHKKEASAHTAAKALGHVQQKKSGHGSANWGSLNEEILEGIDIVQKNEHARGSATAADLGMSKLSTSVSSTSSSASDSSA